jgi:hydroxypyruvate isomerase
MQRRDFLASSVTAATALPLVAALASAAPPVPAVDPSRATSGPTPRKGNIRHSVSAWCFSGMPLEKLCSEASMMGFSGIDLLSENEWETPRKYGMVCSIANGPTTISQGLNRVENHDRVEAECHRLLPLAAKSGVTEFMLFSGNRFDMSDEQGLTNCAKALERVLPIAKANGVTIVMELLNSRVDHKDYMCDKTPWGVELCRRVGADNFRLLYDIYHMQIMEGDVIRTIRNNHQYFSHYHTAGNPGRNEIDLTQELNYVAICETLKEVGFKGFLGQEFMPRRDAMTSLRESIDLCDV